MTPLETAYLATSGALVVAGLTLVALAVRAYHHTERRAMVHLSLGFALVVAATAATAIGAFATDFHSVTSLLLVNSGFTATGYLFVVYSLLTYD